MCYHYQLIIITCLLTVFGCLSMQCSYTYIVAFENYVGTLLLSSKHHRKTLARRYTCIYLAGQVTTGSMLNYFPHSLLNRQNVRLIHKIQNYLRHFKCTSFHHIYSCVANLYFLIFFCHSVLFLVFCFSFINFEKSNMKQDNYVHLVNPLIK